MEAPETIPCCDRSPRPPLRSVHHCDPPWVSGRVSCYRILDLVFVVPVVVVVPSFCSSRTFDGTVVRGEGREVDGGVFPFSFFFFL